MKKMVTVMMVLFLCAIFAACSLEKGDTSNANITFGDSEKFSDEELQAAADAILDKFSADFKCCTLTDLWYDEEDSDNAVSMYMTGGRGAINGVDSANVVVFYSDFDVDENGAEEGFYPNSSESGWSWIVIRDSADSDWVVDDWGY